MSRRGYYFQETTPSLCSIESGQVRLLLCLPSFRICNAHTMVSASFHALYCFPMRLAACMYACSVIPWHLSSSCVMKSCAVNSVSASSHSCRSPFHRSAFTSRSVSRTTLIRMRLSRNVADRCASMRIVSRRAWVASTLRLMRASREASPRANLVLRRELFDMSPVSAHRLTGTAWASCVFYWPRDQLSFVYQMGGGRQCDV